MKLPPAKEEYLVWPPIGAGAAILVGATGFRVLTSYHAFVSTQGAIWTVAGYLFPVAMGLAFAVRLHGKYWLGFAWLAFVVYLPALAMSFFPLAGLPAEVFFVLVCLSLMFAVQSFLLYGKRHWIQGEET